MRIVRNVLALILLTSSCIDIIDFDTDSERILTIYGRITDAYTNTPFVSVSYTVQQDGEIEPEDRATVTLIINDDISIPFVHSEQGKYIPSRRVIGEPGSSYHIEVEIEDRVYKSAPEQMPVAVGADSVRYEVGTTTFLSEAGTEAVFPSIDIFFESFIPQEKVYLRWDSEEVYTYTEMILPAFRFPFYSPKQCFITKPIFSDKLFLFNNFNNTADNIPERKFVTRKIDDTFEEIHYFAILQSSLTKEAFEYWENVDQVVNRDGSIFEIPPATVRGNIFNEEDGDEIVLGYFEAAKMDTSSFYVTNEELSIFIPPICDVLPASSFRNIPTNCFPCVVEELGVLESCLQCTILPNSSLLRPPYFPDINY